MNKTQKIRDVLNSAGHPLTIDQLQPRLERKLKQIIGRQKLYTLLSVMQHAGELISMGRGDDRFYMLKKGKA